MEKKKKSNCGCFSFFRSRAKTSSKAQDASFSIQKSLSANLKLDHSDQPSSSIEHSLGVTQKLAPNTETFRSNIITPSRRTPQMHRFLPSAFLFKPMSHKTEADSSLETGISRPTTFNELPKSSDLVHAHLKKPKKAPEPSGEELTETNFIQRVKESFQLKMVPEGSASPEILGIQEKKSQIRFKFPESPDFFSSSSRLSDKNLPNLEISPIKCLASVDDYSDILSIINNSEKLRSIPDIFIRSSARSRQMPVLKPTTPYYFTKKRVIPVFRQNNKDLLNNFKSS